MPPSAEQPRDIPTPAEIGEALFSTPYKMHLGIWIVRLEVGDPFDVWEASQAFEGATSILNPQGIARRLMPTFVNTGLVERLEPCIDNQRLHKWARLKSPWWELFEVATKIAAQYPSAQDQPEPGE